MFCKNRGLANNVLAILLLASFISVPGYAEHSAVRAGSATDPKTEALDRFTGQYRSAEEPDIVYSIFRQRDHLTIESARIPSVQLTAESATSFVSREADERLQFTLDSTGKVTGAKRTAGSSETSLERISDRPVHYHFRPYSRQVIMIPMRDGIKLHAIVLRPTDTSKPLPFLMQRTPYGVDWADSDSVNVRYTELAQSGYIFVMEDIRGRYESEGKFVMMRPIAPRHDPRSSDPNQIDESTDTYDTVAWLIRNIPANNGRVGVYGISYPGFLAAEAGIDPHPAVRAISPQAPMTDVWLGDDFFHNGAFRQTYGYDYALGMESSKENSFRQTRRGRLYLLPQSRIVRCRCEAVRLKHAAHLAGLHRAPSLR